MNRSIDDTIAGPEIRHFSDDFVLHQRIKLWAKYLAGCILIISLLVLIGWQFNISFLKRPIPRLVAMNPLTAILFACSGVSLFFLTARNRSSKNSTAGKILAIFVLIIGALQFISEVFNLNIPVDTFLFNNKLDQDTTGNISSRMATGTALNFMFAGFALLLLNFETSKEKMPSQLLAILIGLIGLLFVIGYIYGVNALYGILVYVPMAVHTAACFLFLSMAILFVNSGKGVMKELTSPFNGSIVARFLIPAAIIIPILLGFIRLIATRKGYLPLELGVALLVLSIIIIFLILTWFIVLLINKRDMVKQEAENVLRQNEQQVQMIFNAAPDAVIVINEEGKVIKWNPMAESILGWRETEVLGKLLSDTIIPERFREVHKKGLKHFLRTGEG
ncbi:MAG TPA: PAS domain-containing protein, partial [Chitinophagaceae bacterium]|nr:PAS domain-containing protein [Chitinophagaceae bacterium]